MIIESIKEGFSLANRNAQLVFLRLAVTFINLFSLIVFLGVPLLAAIAFLGFDLAYAREILPALAKDPLQFISRYLGLVALMALSLLLYLTFTSVLYIYTLSGTLGIIKKAAVNLQFTFRMSYFFKEANSNFSRLFWLLALLSLIFGAVIAIVALFGGVLSLSLHTFAGAGSFVEVFFGSFVMMSVVVIGVVVILTGMLLGVFSMLASVIEGSGPLDSVKKGFQFMKKKPESLLLFITLFAAVAMLNLGLIFIKLPVTVIPFAGPFLHILISIIGAVVQSYMAVVLWSSLMTYYIKGVGYPVYRAGYEI
jgi:hypothetical protein